MFNMSTTVTVRQLRHDLKSVEKAIAKGPVTVTKRGKVVWTIRAEKLSKTKAAKFDAAAHDACNRAVLGDRLAGIDVRDFIG